MSKANAIFSILTSFILFSCTRSNKSLSCSDFRIGTFSYKQSQSGNLYSISRNDSIQREYSLTTGGVVFAKIKWVSECEYELQYISDSTATKDSIAEYIKAHTLTSKILKTASGEINGTRYNYCIIESSMPGISQKLRDTLWKHDATD